MIRWQTEFETGSELIDGQHRELIDKINELELLLRSREIPREEASALMDFLVSYSMTHFHVEEQCMEQHRCPAAADNRAEHDKFMQVMIRMKAESDNGGQTRERLSELHSMVSFWMQNHILKIDIQLKPCMRTRV